MLRTSTACSKRWPEGVSVAMSFWQLIAAALCVLINVLDGFDILLMSVAAPAIGADLHLTTAEVGFVF